MLVDIGEFKTFMEYLISNPEHAVSDDYRSMQTPEVSNRIWEAFNSSKGPEHVLGLFTELFPQFGINSCVLIYLTGFMLGVEFEKRHKEGTSLEKLLGL